MNESEVRKLFFILINSYNGFDDNDDKVQIWLTLLHDVPFEVAHRNLWEHCNTNKFPPTPSEIRNPPYRDPEVNVDHAKRLADTMLYLDEVDKQRAQIAPPPWLNGGTG